MTETTELLIGLKQARELLESEDGAGEFDLRQILKSGSPYRIHDYERQGDRPVGTIDCGSVRMEDTPTTMYRAMFLFQPDSISFKKMYKGSLMTLASPDYNLVASLEFYKFELGLYFSASRDHIAGRGSSVICGAPGADNGVKFNGELAEQWFGLLTDMLTRKWMVYDGNNFEV